MDLFKRTLFNHTIIFSIFVVAVGSMTGQRRSSGSLQEIGEHLFINHAPFFANLPTSVHGRIWFDMLNRVLLFSLLSIMYSLSVSWIPVFYVVQDE